MTRENIRMFVLEYLKTKDKVSAKDLQQYISGCEEVGIPIDADEISFVLEDMSFAQELYVSSGYGFDRKYRLINKSEVKDYSDMVVAIDVDDVFAELVDRWLEMYNADHYDNLKKEDITDWNIGKFTKIGDEFYNYLLDDDLYNHVDLVSGALNGVKKIRGTGARAIFLTAGLHPGKFDFLVEAGAIETNDDYVIAHDKSLINADILIDDKYENVKNFPGHGILLDKPWNRKHNDVTRAMDWRDIITILFGVEKQKSKSKSW